MADNDEEDGVVNPEENDAVNPPAPVPQFQPCRYTAMLGPMLGGSFPASVAIYNIIKGSSDIVKFWVFGGVTLAVFAIVFGLAASTLGRTVETTRYASAAALLAVTIVMALFTGALCTLFSAVGLGYMIGCAILFGALILVLLGVWIQLRW